MRLLHTICVCATLIFAWLNQQTNGAFLDCGTGRNWDCIKLGKYMKMYDRIDKYLTENVHTEDIDTNMAAIDLWIKAETEHGVTADQTALLDALYQVYDLSLNDGSDKCTLLTHNNLKNNDRATRGVLRKLKPGEVPERRIERIVYHYAKKHAIECESYYLNEYERIIPKITRKIVERVRTFIEDLIVSRLRKHPEYQRKLNLTSINRFVREKSIKASEFVESIKAVRGTLDAEIANRWLEKFATENNDPDARFLHKIQFKRNQEPYIDSLKFWLLFKKHLVQPCEEFVGILDPIFKRDLALVKESVKDEPGSLENDFYRDLAYYRVCRTVIQDENNLFKEMKKLRLKEDRGGLNQKQQTESEKVAV